MAMQPQNAREVAAQVLARVWRDGAYAAPSLDAELRRAELPPRDGRLATELVYGVLRTEPTLSRAIARHASSPKWKKQPLLRAHLTIAAYSIFFLDRVPGFAAVSEAVTALRRGADKRVAGFANAVLRKLTDDPAAPSLAAACADSLPGWLREALASSLGDGGAAAFIEASGAPAALSLCLRAGQDRDAWLERLSAHVPDASFRAGELSPRNILATGAGDHRKLPGADEAWTVQEQGAQAIALAVGGQPGDHILDACAGRGGKTLLLAEQVAPQGKVDAADRHPSKLRRLSEGPWGAAIGDTFAVDWTRGSGDIAAQYDRVLVDAPCSGVGTLRRRPEIAGRLTAEDVGRLASLQTQLLRAAARHLRPGGRLVYAVCSVLRAEAEDVVSAVADGSSDCSLELAPFDCALPAFADASAVRLLPHEHGSDGYFVASFVARGSDATA